VAGWSPKPRTARTCPSFLKPGSVAHPARPRTPGEAPPSPEHAPAAQAAVRVARRDPQGRTAPSSRSERKPAYRRGRPLRHSTQAGPGGTFQRPASRRRRPPVVNLLIAVSRRHAHVAPQTTQAGPGATSRRPSPGRRRPQDVNLLVAVSPRHAHVAPQTTRAGRDVSMTGIRAHASTGFGRPVRLHVPPGGPIPWRSQACSRCSTTSPR